MTDEEKAKKIMRKETEADKLKFERAWLQARQDYQELKVTAERMEKCLERISEEKAWRDRGHCCESKIRLEAIVNRTKEALKSYRDGKK